MSQYTPEQVEARADMLPEDCPEFSMLRAYAATLRQQSDGVTDEVVERACVAASTCEVEGCVSVPWPCDYSDTELRNFRAFIRCALEAVWPQAALAQSTQVEERECGNAHGSLAHRLYCEIACTGHPACFFGLPEVTQRRWIDGVNAVFGDTHPERAMVPAEMPQQGFREDDPEQFGYVRGFNACRDLVLAAAPFQPAADSKPVCKMGLDGKPAEGE